MSLTSFSRPPHFRLHDAEAAEYRYVQAQPASSKLGWLAAFAVTACVMLGVVAWAPYSQPQALYTQQTTVTRPATMSVNVPQNAVAAPQAAEAIRQAQVAATTAAVTMAPFAAQAAVTSSLKNLGLSVIAGGVVLGGIAGAVVLVSQFDKVDRA
jgi:nucleoid-associated protein YgaU|mmetsp:Transcript_60792/g.100450  ORF Transcript_60792/g.100450 Transcript_60792/m.100450 type:complete len:154 (-) Transcript_60792:437-898(-)|eukprot:CAMPEP_0174285972 /NCGR_PEP_ID=MMETSP0809-20121228/10179_1 /TAXON_ID=73025 ORGANISM="Eutreptiella gymnastica-like, Strain CCMP1594" /NCGR_SAMPLE_ID=MMETSP0809 /ASSEMBLY_ACC=CAM_ASM_000658 /LENGTH=153 /DNA_ID=CAMNT_0015381869 /DNA_START=33 /DNA_END=494 /DNA_ORIENTATION=-